MFNSFLVFYYSFGFEIFLFLMTGLVKLKINMQILPTVKNIITFVPTLVLVRIGLYSTCFSSNQYAVFYTRHDSKHIT